MISHEQLYSRAFKILIMISVLKVVSYAVLYMVLVRINPESFWGLNSESNIIDYLYFSIVTFTTTGIGDIYPLTTVGRFFVSTELVFGVMFMIAIIFCIARRSTPCRGSGS